ncbi:MAG TPA: tetratricopeptide repeat protein [Deltaproteobacteria bacterium]|jgi:tetratricopeptide (TPR) repeat protein|nr:tetratricopeptide repeat protein [Deltaproteobacteria bacterium]HOI06891.1 tetratricopeptide repeat protein [Deltaproteobacteria bacterium]
MKRVSLAIMVLVMMALPMGVMAEDFIGDAKEQLKLKTLDGYKKAVDLSLKGLQQQPQSYEANWVAAKAHRLYGDESKKQNVSGWKNICKEYGKKGMGYAEKAIALDKSKVEGHFWYGCSVGTYSDGVSIVTALKEGLKNKTQTGFETSYRIDRMYEDGGPMKALGRFWSVLPWPMKDKKKAVMYLEEFNKSFPNDAEGQLYLGQAYIDAGEKDKAKALLTKAAAAGPKDKYYADLAKALLANL